MPRKICVIGAGIIGVTTAVCIQDRIPNAQITIMAAEFSPENTSDVAAGIILPYMLPEEDPQKVREWCHETILHCRRYMKEKPNGGAQEKSGYLFTKSDDKTPFWHDIVSNFHRLSPKELAEKHPLPQKAGFFFTTLYMQPTKHIEWLMEKFHKRGGRMVKRQLKKLSDVGEGWDVVVNCSGIGARHLFGDEKLIPVRGQIIRARAPQVKHFFIDDDFHTLLNDDCVILGGTKGVNEWHLSVEEDTIKRIIDGTKRNIPSLEGAEILSHHVGLRPFRPKIRLETEIKEIQGKMTPVVHNYGHGGSGITLCWGTALDATKLIEKELGTAKM